MSQKQLASSAITGGMSSTDFKVLMKGKMGREGKNVRCVRISVCLNFLSRSVFRDLLNCPQKLKNALQNMSGEKKRKNTHISSSPLNSL